MRGLLGGSGRQYVNEDLKRYTINPKFVLVLCGYDCEVGVACVDSYWVWMNKLSKGCFAAISSD